VIQIQNIKATASVNSYFKTNESHTFSFRDTLRPDFEEKQLHSALRLRNNCLFEFHVVVLRYLLQIVDFQGLSEMAV
jgi:hypothetical protein